jgi:hypothetical protein
VTTRKGTPHRDQRGRASGIDDLSGSPLPPLWGFSHGASHSSGTSSGIYNDPGTSNPIGGRGGCHDGGPGRVFAVAPFFRPPTPVFFPLYRDVDKPPVRFMRAGWGGPGMRSSTRVPPFVSAKPTARHPPSSRKTVSTTFPLREARPNHPHLKPPASLVQLVRVSTGAYSVEFFSFFSFFRQRSGTTKLFRVRGSLGGSVQAPKSLVFFFFLGPFFVFFVLFCLRPTSMSEFPIVRVHPLGPRSRQGVAMPGFPVTWVRSLDPRTRFVGSAYS